MEGSRSLFTARGRCVSSVEVVSRPAEAGRKVPGVLYPERVIGAISALYESRQKGGQGREGFQGSWLNIQDLHAGGETHGRGVKSTSLSEAAG